MVLRACLLSTAIAATLLTTSLPSAAQTAETRAEQSANPLTAAWNTPDGVPPYDRIRPEHYEPAFDLAIAEARAESQRIANDPAAPTFENTIEAMERAGRQLSRVSSTFFTVASADATPANQAIQKNVAPKLARLSNEMMLDQNLFQRVDTLYKTRADLGLTPEQTRLLEQTHKRFVRAGAALSPDARTRVAAINEELANLGVAFGQKLLADQKANDVFLSEAEVEGLPADQRSAAAAAASAAGQPGAFLFPATRSSAEPFLTAAPNRDAREKIWRAFTYRGDNDNANNTSEEIKRLVELRIERAELMGAASHADFVLEDSMAKTTDAAMELLMAVYQPALVRAQEELRDWIGAARENLSGAFTELAAKVFDEKGQQFAKNVRLATGQSRTDIVFPSSEVDAARSAELEHRLHAMDVGSEAVFVGGMAMHELLTSLGVEPDVMLGHSSGESAALSRDWNGSRGVSPVSATPSPRSCADFELRQDRS